MSSSLKFNIQQIQDSDGLTFREKVEPGFFEKLDLPAKLTGPVAVELDFSVGASRVLMSGQFEAKWELECSRCLTVFKAPVRGLLEETYEAQDVEIDAGEEIRQGMILGLPPKPLCRKDCKGLCPKCGKNLNEGACGCVIAPPSPFDKLKALKNPKKPTH